MCGKTFERKKSEVDKNRRHYCSNECRIEGIRWSESDVKILRENYRKIPNSEIRKLLSKDYSEKAIKSRAQDFGFARSRNWTKDEEEIVKMYYEKIPMYKVLDLLPGRTFPSLMHKAKELNLKSYVYLTKIYTEEQDKFLRENYLTMTDSQLSKFVSHNANGIHQHLLHLGLYRPFEVQKDGYKDLKSYIRSRLWKWADEVREAYNYKCALTGLKSNLVIHHIHGFNLLFDETMDILNFPEKDDFTMYSDSELEIFFTTFYNLQECYGEYICINKDIHKLFHSIYGYGNNTKEQWNEFVQDYNNNKFAEIA